MKPNDKILIGIVVGILVLVLVAVVITITRKEPMYVLDDNPGGVVNNYFLALQKGDYLRAYGYLSPSLPGYPPDASAFEKEIKESTWIDYSSSSLKIGGVKISGNEATVTMVRYSFDAGDLVVSSGSIDSFDVTLNQVSGGWKISDAEYMFPWCFTSETGCNY